MSDNDPLVTITVRLSTLRTALSALFTLAREFEKPSNVDQVMSAYAELREAARRR